MKLSALLKLAGSAALRAANEGIRSLRKRTTADHTRPHRQRMLPAVELAAPRVDLPTVSVAPIVRRRTRTLTTPRRPTKMLAPVQRKRIEREPLHFAV